MLRLQLPLPIPPVRHGSVQKLIKRGSVVVFDQMSEFVSDDVVDAGWGSLDQEQVQQDAAGFTRPPQVGNEVRLTTTGFCHRLWQFLGFSNISHPMDEQQTTEP